MWLWSYKIVLVIGFLTVHAGEARAQETPTTPPAPAAVTAPIPHSLAVHLALTVAQREQLDREYARFIDVWQKEDARIAVWQAELSAAQSALTFDEGLATRRTKDILRAQQAILTAFMRMRGAALRLLTPIQRAQLETIAQNNAPIVDDTYRLLLLVRPDQPGQPAPNGAPTAPPVPSVPASTPTVAQRLYPPVTYVSPYSRPYLVRVAPYSGFNTGFFIGRPLSGFNSHLHRPSATLSHTPLVSVGHHTGSQHSLGSHYSAPMSHHRPGQHQGGHHRRH